MTPESVEAVTAVLEQYGRALEAAVGQAKAAAANAKPTASPEAVKEAADTLLRCGWITETQHSHAVGAIGDHGGALGVLSNLAEKAASLAARDRLAVGQSVDGKADAEKQASDDGNPYAPSKADEEFMRRMTRIRPRA